MQIRAILQSQILDEHRRQVVNINPTVLAPFSFVLRRLSHGGRKRNRLRGNMELNLGMRGERERRIPGKENDKKLDKEKRRKNPKTWMSSNLGLKIIV
nr:hypothetical protein Iba_chr01aCG2970 [Ipomoea batatas]GME03703.1 hypothetical protein Iba_scaffold1050CG0250 [Ipomoea batatas]GME10697.1 hypothetical protein Iba_scaffold10432CG0010 [Ipomoea batatas]